MPLHRLVVSFALLTALPAFSQSMPDMPGMQSKPVANAPTQMSGTMSMAPPNNFIEAQLQHTSSGTTQEPPSTPMHMLMLERGGWQLMLHGTAFLADTQQHTTQSPSVPPSCPACAIPNRRGTGKLFSTNWIMPMAQRRLGPGQLTLRTMLTLEPVTISHGYYPELFQQGETANGKPILDGQHPHDFVMELAALYDIRLGRNALISLYAAPVGDPAIGPTAYPHRESASEDPIAALGHHQQDSTHIAFNVITASVTYKTVRVEGSGFHGAEPTEARWHLSPSPNGHAVDSYSSRLTWVPSRNWAAQYSIAHITQPEQLRPNEDQRRQTASVMYTRAMGAHHDTTSMPGMDMGSPATGSLAITALWGQARALQAATTENSYLVEVLLHQHRNAYWTRIELAGRSSELLNQPSLSANESPAGHVAALTLGYDRRFQVTHLLSAAPGVQLTMYCSSDPLASTYGRSPFGAVAFIHFRLGTL